MKARANLDKGAHPARYLHLSLRGKGHAGKEFQDSALARAIGADNP